MKLLFKLIILFSTVSGLVNGAEEICIDPGHQAKGNMQTEEIAPGSSKRKPKVAYGTRGVATKKPEYQLALEVGLKLRDALKAKGYEVFMIRETNDVNISNKERALMTNKAGCSVYLRLHADAGGSSVRGATVLTSSAKNPHTKAYKNPVTNSQEQFYQNIQKQQGLKAEELHIEMTLQEQTGQQLQIHY